MLKYINYEVTFQEVPDEISLCINISNCPNHCKGCHSQYLWEDKGAILDDESLFKLIDQNNGITCVAFMGGDNDPDQIKELAQSIKENYDLKVCWYSGKSLLTNFDYTPFDFVKTGPYIEEYGGLDNPNTNQKFYKIINKYHNQFLYSTFEDITYKFQGNGRN